MHVAYATVLRRAQLTISQELSRLSALCSGEIVLVSAIESKAQTLVDELARILPKKNSLSGRYSSLRSLRAAATAYLETK